MTGSLRSSLLILVLSTLDNTMGTTNSSPIRRTEFSIAVNTSRYFTCTVPQLRAYHLRDLTQSLYQNTGESAIQPAYIVLKRCDGHAGCCTSPEMSCVPKETYSEDVEIMVGSLSNNTRKQWIRVEQHAECGCAVTTTGDRLELEHRQPNVTLV